eukprot:139226_1
MSQNGSLRKQVLMLYRTIMRHGYQCKNAEYRKYILSEARSEFMKYKLISDEIVIRERIHDGQSRVLCYRWYGNPYPRDHRDIQRVWLMGAGYSKRGKVHQQFSKRDNKFHTHDRRNQQHAKTGLNRIRKLTRKPGEYDLPVFEKDMAHDVPQIIKDRVDKKMKDSKSQKSGNEQNGSDKQ